jgi:hypothetical protein
MHEGGVNVGVVFADEADIDFSCLAELLDDFVYL